MSNLKRARAPSRVVVWQLVPQLVSRSLIQLELRGPSCWRLRRLRGRQAKVFQDLLHHRPALELAKAPCGPIGMDSPDRATVSLFANPSDTEHLSAPVPQSRRTPLRRSTHLAIL